MTPDEDWIESRARVKDGAVMTDLATRGSDPVAPGDELAAPARRERPLAAAGGETGILSLLRHRHLLRLLVRKELRIRYSRSSLGYAWSYVRPAVQLGIYILIVGLLFDRGRVENFPVYIFSGHVLVHFYSETVNSATRSILRNKALVKKVYLPREMFPVASLVVSATHMIPPLILLMVVATATGWSPSVSGLLAALLGFAVVALIAISAGLLFSALNVFYRDVQNIVDILNMLNHWIAPMIYPWTLMAERLNAAGAGWVLHVYLWNPICVGVELFHQAFWLSTVEDFELSPDLWLRGLSWLGIGCVLVYFSQRVFVRLQYRFAEEL